MTGATSSTGAPLPKDQAHAIASGLPYADVLAPQLDLFWALNDAGAQWTNEAAAVAETGKVLEELDADPGDWTAFVDQRLLPQLDTLGQWASDADGALQQILLRLLFVRFGAVLQARGVAALLRVVPGRDLFDATVHKAQGSAEGPSGTVMRLMRVGLRDPRSGALLRPAEVLVAP